jgi:carbon storage regulator
MLVLTRRVGEVIVIDGLIRVKMLTDGPAVRLGIEAPRDVRIMRAELVRADEPFPPRSRTLLAAQHEALMREAGSQRFVRRVHDPLSA